MLAVFIVFQWQNLPFRERFKFIKRAVFFTMPNCGAAGRNSAICWSCAEGMSALLGAAVLGLNAQNYFLPLAAIFAVLIQRLVRKNGSG